MIHSGDHIVCWIFIASGGCACPRGAACFPLALCKHHRWDNNPERSRANRVCGAYMRFLIYFDTRRQCPPQRKKRHYVRAAIVKHGSGGSVCEMEIDNVFQDDYRDESCIASHHIQRLYSAVYVSAVLQVGDEFYRGCRADTHLHHTYGETESERKLHFWQCLRMVMYKLYLKKKKKKTLSLNDKCYNSNTAVGTRYKHVANTGRLQKKRQRARNFLNHIFAEPSV